MTALWAERDRDTDEPLQPELEDEADIAKERDRLKKALEDTLRLLDDADRSRESAHKRANFSAAATVCRSALTPPHNLADEMSGRGIESEDIPPTR